MAVATETKLIAAGAVVVLVVLWYAKNKVSQAAGAVGDVLTHELNPASDQNLVYSGISGLGASVSGKDDWTLGGWIYDVTHPNP